MAGLNIYLRKIIKVLNLQALINSINAVIVSIDGKITGIGALFNRVHDFGCGRLDLGAVSRRLWVANLDGTD